jgi:hypothetical protein
MRLYPALDSNALTYLLDAIAADDYDPALDRSPLTKERLAMAWCLFHGNCSPWVPPTARAEYQRIKSDQKREVHRRWTQYHLQDQDLDVPDDVIERRVGNLLRHHHKVEDCRVLAETEFARLKTLLTVDETMRVRLQPHTTVEVLLPSEFWKRLAITANPHEGRGPLLVIHFTGRTGGGFPIRRRLLEREVEEARRTVCNACAADSRTRDRTRPRPAAQQKSRPRFSEVGCERRHLTVRTLAFASVIAVALLARPGVAQQRANFMMGRGYVGDLKVGMRGDEVVTLFGKERVREVDLPTENPESERAFEVRLDELNAAAPSLVVRLDPATARAMPLHERRVRGIDVSDARFRTADGLGVGSTMRQISARHRVQVGYGEGTLKAVVESLGMTFDFTAYYSTGRVPPDARAESVWIWSEPSAR